MPRKPGAFKGAKILILESHDIDYLSIFFNSKSLHNLARLESERIDSIIREGWLSKSAAQRRSSFKALLDFNSSNSFYLPLAHCPLVFALAPRMASHYGGAINTTVLKLDHLKAKP